MGGRCTRATHEEADVDGHHHCLGGVDAASRTRARLRRLRRATSQRGVVALVSALRLHVKRGWRRTTASTRHGAPELASATTECGALQSSGNHTTNLAWTSANCKDRRQSSSRTEAAGKAHKHLVHATTRPHNAKRGYDEQPAVANAAPQPTPASRNQRQAHSPHNAYDTYARESPEAQTVSRYRHGHTLSRDGACR